MTTHITKTWFDGEKVVTQEIHESEVYKQEPVAWEDVLGAIARGWTHPENAQKPMDVQLAVAIAKEIQDMYTTPPAAPQPVTLEAVYETIIQWDEGGKRSRRELARRIAALHTTPPAAQTAPAQKPLAWADEIIADLHALYDSEMITENDSGDALIRLDAAICAVEEAEERHTTPPAAQTAQRQPLTEDQIDDIWNRHCDEMGEASINDAYDIARAIEAAHGIKENT